MIFGPLAKISPSSAIFKSTLSNFTPTVPNLIFSGVLLVRTGEVSVKPYPSNIVIPIPEKNSAIF